MSEKEKSEYLCCLCLTSDSANAPFNNIFTKTSDGLTWFDKISLSLYQLRNVLNKYANYNYNVCTKCSESIEMIYKFNLNWLLNIEKYYKEKGSKTLELPESEKNDDNAKNNEIQPTQRCDENDQSETSSGFQEEVEIDPELNLDDYIEALLEQNDRREYIRKLKERIVAESDEEPEIDENVATEMNNLMETMEDLVNKELINSAASEPNVTETILIEDQEDHSLGSDKESYIEENLISEKMAKKIEKLKQRHFLRSAYCGCRKKCYNKIPEDYRIAIHNRFWSSNVVDRRCFIRENVDELKLTKCKSSKKFRTFKFHFTFNGIKIQVCRIFFMRTLGYNDWCNPMDRSFKIEPFSEKQDFELRKTIPALRIDRNVIKNHIDRMISVTNRNEKEANCMFYYKDFHKNHPEIKCSYRSYLKIYQQYCKAGL